jgi:hypothetical protein
MTSDEAAPEAVREEDPNVERLLRRERELLAWATDALLPAGWVALDGSFWWGWTERHGPPHHSLAVGNCLFRRGFAEAAVMAAKDLVPGATTAGVLGGRARVSMPYPPPGLFLFRSEPLTAVTLAGRRPRRHDVGDWGWWDRMHYEQGEDDLPTVLWDRLPGGENDGPPPTWKNYPSEAAAREVLSRACVDFGREWAGLPALEWGPLL